ncbi:MAG: hypothetical protein ACK42C_09800 [Aquificaceae bacterium]|jgi:hypothetical protein|uniref:hypothetical protein n=1 Tax=Hydrogenobacter sp. Uz 6-8 TaxID=3384828 RepID=UPI0030A483B2
MKNFDREKAVEYVKRLESLKDLLSACLEEVEVCASYAPVEGCEVFMKRLYDSLKEHQEAVQEAIEHWNYMVSVEE